MAIPRKESVTKGLVFLDKKSAILHEQLYPMLFDNKREPCEICFEEFDEFRYKLSIDVSTPNIVKLHIGYNCSAEFKKNGSDELLMRLFPGMDTTPDESYDTCLQFDLDAYAKNTQFLDDISSIKRHILGGPFHQAFTALEEGKSLTSTLSFPYRPNECLYIVPSETRVAVIFQVDVAETMDRAMAKIFLQEFVESRRSISTAPSVAFSKDPPGELAGIKVNVKDTTAGFILFSIEKRHIEGSKKENAITLLTGFRSYLLYHIKCSKTYLQMRMRKRVAGWIQVLNRAMPEVETEKKTAAGKTFTRK